MKLYISYYDNYISIIEGRYNSKKDKFIIKDSIKLSIKDVKIDNNDKYSLLKEVLRNNKFKAKDVFFMLNTRDVIIKSNTVPKVNKKDLDGIMNNEIYDMMSLDSEEYVFSYEVTNEREVENSEMLDVIIAALSKKDVNEIIEIFKEFKLNLHSIDTMSTAYIRLLQNIEYEDMMVVNVGEYGSFCNIYVNDTLFISDNIPIKIDNTTGDNQVLSLLDEINGLANFYSSRNFGKSLKNILVIGESKNNEHIKELFTKSLNTKIIFGIEKLYYIADDIEGNIDEEEISSISEILGCMLADNRKNSYSYMNLLPLELKNKISKQRKNKNIILMLPILAITLTAPYFIFWNLERKVQKDIVNLENRLQEIVVKYNGIGDIEEEIKSVKNEINIYDMLINKKTNWTDILNSIERSIPYLIDLTDLNVYYDNSLENSIGVNEKNTEDITNNNESENEVTNETIDNIETSEEVSETELFNKIPNFISLQGVSNSNEKIGQFVYTLSGLDYFESVKLKYSEKDEEKQKYKFEIVLKIKESVISSE